MTHVERIRTLFMGYAQQAQAEGDGPKAKALIDVVVAFDMAREQLARAVARDKGSNDVAGYLAEVDQLIDDGRIVCETDDTGLTWTLRAVDLPAEPPLH